MRRAHTSRASDVDEPWRVVELKGRLRGMWRRRTLDRRHEKSAPNLAQIPR